MAHSIHHTWVPICSLMTYTVYLLPFLSYLAGSKSVYAHPSNPDTMTTTAIEAPASSSGKNKANSFPTNHLSCQYCSRCESWTLTAELERRIQAFENKCYRNMLGISYREHKTNEYIWQLVNIYAGYQELCQPSSIASYRGLAISAVMICCQKSYYRKQ